MKHAKKFIALALVIVSLLAIAAPALAATKQLNGGTGSHYGGSSANPNGKKTVTYTFSCSGGAGGGVVVCSLQYKYTSGDDLFWKGDTSKSVAPSVGGSSSQSLTYTASSDRNVVAWRPVFNTGSLAGSTTVTYTYSFK